VGVLAIGLAVPAGAFASRLHVNFTVQAVGTGAWQQDRSISFTEDVYFQGQKIGNDSVACRFFKKRNALYCHAVFNLPKGSIFANGWVANNPTGTFPVTVSNGTNTYTDAKGTVYVTPTKTGDNYRFSFTI
jgi:hypothetical protein